MSTEKDHEAKCTDREVEDGPEQEYIEKVETKESQTSPGSDVDRLDLENKRAAKGDDSDGKLDWSLKTAGAALSLTGLYVASQLPLELAGGSLAFIAADIGSENISWLLTANQLALGAFAPFVGYLTDLVGRRHIALIGGIAIVVGCVIVGSAHHIGQAIAGMAIAGFGGSIGELSAFAGVAELTPVKLRGVFLGLVAAFVAPFCPYVLYCELLGVNSTWRWAMWIPAIYCGVTVIGIATLYFPPPRHRIDGFTTGQLTKRIDWIGALTSIGGLALLLTGLGNGGGAFPWKSAQVIAPIVVGVLTLIAFVVWEAKYAPHPMVPAGLFKGRRAVTFALALNCTVGLFFVPILSYYPLSLNYIYPTLSPVAIGLRALGFGLGLVAGTLGSSSLISYSRGHVRPLFVSSSIVLTCFTAGLAAMSPTDSILPSIMASIAGLGLGGIVSAFSLVMVCAPDSIIATACGLCLAIRAFGGALASTIFGTILQNKIKIELPKAVATYAIKAGLSPESVVEFVTVFLTDPKKIASVSGVTPRIIEAAEIGATYGYTNAFKYVWYASIPFGVLGMICSLCVPNVRKYLTNRVAVLYH